MSADGALGGRRWWLASGFVLALALAATSPTTGDLGLTWDEPAYRYSQLMSAQWWERLAAARTRADLAELLDPDTLLLYWPYARYGRNFHPPLAGQLSLLTHALFGGWMKDIPARRLASVFEFALTVALAFGFLARRYNAWVGAVAAGSLLLMPRLYGDAHIAGTDTPGLLLWAATALAFWKGLYEPHARRWRVAVGVLVGLGFVEKMAAVMVVGPLLIWLVVAHLPRTLTRRSGWADWADGLITSAAMLAPLGLGLYEILRLARLLPPPANAILFGHSGINSPTSLPGGILAIPLVVWIVRRGLGRLARRGRHPIWGVERPALETWLAILAFAPVVGWLGNPAWWRESFVRLAHYYALSTDRRGALPDIQILYAGQAYEYSLPWHNAWVLIAITVPVGILASALIGLVYGFRVLRRDRLPAYFLIHLAALPVMRMLPTPGHDGVRLFLPTFFFLAAFAGWGLVWFADGLARLVGRGRREPSLDEAAIGEDAVPSSSRARTGCRAVLAVLVLGSAGWQLVRIHPYELSYYNEAIGGPAGAWDAGFELTYWYDAFTPRTIEELNRRLPPDATLDFINPKTNVPVFVELQSLGHLRRPVRLGSEDQSSFPFVWLLTQDSKASAFTRLLFAMRPWYSESPRQLQGARVLTVADPEAVSRAWALQLLTDAPDLSPPEPPAAPEWVRRRAPRLARLWGDGLTKVKKLTVNEPILDWAGRDPDEFRAAARKLVETRGQSDDPAAARLRAVLTRYDNPQVPDRQGMFFEKLLRARPEGLIEAVEILIGRPDAVRAVLTRYSYTDPERVGGYLDRGLAAR